MANDPNSVFSDPEMTSHTQSDTSTVVVQRNSKGRMILIIVGSLFFLLVAFVVMSMMGGKKPTTDAGKVPSAPKVEDVPGASTSDIYNKKVQEDNAARAQQAGTVLPTLTPDAHPQANDPFPMEQVNPQTPPTQQPTPEVVAPPVNPMPDPVVQTPPPQQVVYTAPAPSAPRYTADQYSAMQSALQTYLQAWQVGPAPAQEFNYTGQKPEPVAVAANAGTMAATSTALATGSSRTTTSASFVRSGTVIPALLMSSINSDNPGPVLAQITSGPLAGARLMGQFQNTGKALVLNFTTLSKPGMGTYSVNVVAVDENYAVGMKTDINNHYFQRYGLLLASAFLQGYGQAMSRSNTTITTGPFGTVESQGPVTSKQARDAALGAVGGAVAQDLSDAGDIPPTVKLECAGGCSVGLLFLSDL